jgi:hypothetical protein
VLDSILLFMSKWRSYSIHNDGGRHSFVLLQLPVSVYSLLSHDIREPVKLLVSCVPKIKNTND